MPSTWTLMDGHGTRQDVTPNFSKLINPRSSAAVTAAPHPRRCLNASLPANMQPNPPRFNQPGARMFALTVSDQSSRQPHSGAARRRQTARRGTPARPPTRTGRSDRHARPAADAITPTTRATCRFSRPAPRCSATAIHFPWWMGLLCPVAGDRERSGPQSPHLLTRSYVNVNLLISAAVWVTPSAADSADRWPWRPGRQPQRHRPADSPGCTVASCLPEFGPDRRRTGGAHPQ